MSQSNLPHTTNPASLLEQIKQAPDLRELHGYLAPLLIRAHNALECDTRFAELDDRRKTENILARDLPDSIENYLKMPLDYRNDKKVNEKKKQAQAQKNSDNQKKETSFSLSRFMSMLQSIFYPKNISSTTDSHILRYNDIFNFHYQVSFFL